MKIVLVLDVYFVTIQHFKIGKGVNKARSVKTRDTVLCSGEGLSRPPFGRHTDFLVRNVVRCEQDG